MGRRNRIELEALPAFADDLLTFVHFEHSDCLTRLTVTAFIQLIRPLSMARFEEWTKDRLITFLDKDRRSHCGSRAHAADMIEMMVRNGDVLYRLSRKLFLDRSPQNLRLSFRIGRIHQSQPL